MIQCLYLGVQEPLAWTVAYTFCFGQVWGVILGQAVTMVEDLIRGRIALIPDACVHLVTTIPSSLWWVLNFLYPHRKEMILVIMIY